jgi:hypothetical protein
MNIYEMYKANNYSFGFYVIRDSWETIIAKVTGIEGVEEGSPIYGRAPYYGSPKVYCEIYKVEDNTAARAVDLCHTGRFVEKTEISCPGTYSYNMTK